MQRRAQLTRDPPAPAVPDRSHLHLVGRRAGHILNRHAKHAEPSQTGNRHHLPLPCRRSGSHSSLESHPHESASNTCGQHHRQLLVNRGPAGPEPPGAPALRPPRPAPRLPCRRTSALTANNERPFIHQLRLGHTQVHAAHTSTGHPSRERPAKRAGAQGRVRDHGAARRGGKNSRLQPSPVDQQSGREHRCRSGARTVPRGGSGRRGLAAHRCSTPSCTRPPRPPSRHAHTRATHRTEHTQRPGGPGQGTSHGKCCSLAGPSRAATRGTGRAGARGVLGRGSGGGGSLHAPCNPPT